MNYWDFITHKENEPAPNGFDYSLAEGTELAQREYEAMKEEERRRQAEGRVVGADVKMPGIDANGNIAPVQQRKSGTELMNGAFADAWNMSKEDTDKTLRRLGAVNGARALSDSILAFANSVYTGKGAQTAEMPKWNMPSQLTFVDRVNEARKEAAKRALEQKRYEDALALQINKEKRLATAQDANNRYMDARIADLGRKGDLDALKAEKLRLDNELRYVKDPLQMQKLQMQIAQIDNHIANENRRTAIAQQNANTSQTRAAKGGAQGGYTTEVTEETHLPAEPADFYDLFDKNEEPHLELENDAVRIAEKASRSSEFKGATAPWTPTEEQLEIARKRASSGGNGNAGSGNGNAGNGGTPSGGTQKTGSTGQRNTPQGQKRRKNPFGKN